MYTTYKHYNYVMSANVHYIQIFCGISTNVHYIQILYAMSTNVRCIQVLYVMSTRVQYIQVDATSTKYEYLRKMCNEVVEGLCESSLAGVPFDF